MFSRLKFVCKHSGWCFKFDVVVDRWGMLIYLWVPYFLHGICFFITLLVWSKILLQEQSISLYTLVFEKIKDHGSANFRNHDVSKSEIYWFVVVENNKVFISIKELRIINFVLGIWFISTSPPGLFYLFFNRYLCLSINFAGTCSKWK